MPDDHGHHQAPSEGSDHHHHDTTGIHGMLLFGEDVVYLSHLPMFSTPHNFQVILEVELDERARRVYLSDRAADSETIHTFQPEKFPIAELSPAEGGPARTEIRGNVFHGHFERGGKEIVADAVATVRSVVEFEELDVEAKHDNDRALAYLCFGRPGDLYLAHDVQARPDFDQILIARLVSGTATDMAGRPHPDADVDELSFENPQRAEVAGRQDTETDRLTPGKTVGADFRAGSVEGLDGFGVKIAVERELYLEVAELA